MDKQFKRYYILEPVSYTLIDGDGLVSSTYSLKDAPRLCVRASSAYEARLRAQPWCMVHYTLMLSSDFCIFNLRVLAIHQKIPEFLKERVIKI